MAKDAAYPFEREHRPQVAPVHPPPPRPSDPGAALAWLDTELPNLLAAAGHAVENDRPRHAVDLSALLHRHLWSRGQHRDAVTLHQQALTAARATGDVAGELNALTNLGYSR